MNHGEKIIGPVGKGRSSVTVAYSSISSHYLPVFVYPFLRHAPYPHGIKSKTGFTVAQHGGIAPHYTTFNKIFRPADDFFVADAMLFSLKNEYIFSLTLPAKVQSYLACGKPVLAMINGEGAATIDEAEAGFTSNAEDPQGLVKNILLMKDLSSRDLLDMGQRSRQYYEDYFERDSLFDRAEKMFGAMLKGNLV